MRRYFVGLTCAVSVAVFGLVSFPAVISAQGEVLLDCSNPVNATNSSCNPDNPNNPCRPGSDQSQSPLCVELNKTGDPISGKDGLLTSAVNVMSYVVGAASIMAVLAGSIRYVVANGDANQISAAKKMIIYALIGVIVSIFAQAIVIFVLR